jgi:signal peptidase I
MKEYIIRHYDNGAAELICVNSNVRRIMYNTGDVIELVDDVVVYISTHNGYKWKDKERQSIVIDAISGYYNGTTYV